MTPIKMHSFGSALHVDVEIWNKASNNFNSAFLVFDTGATVTTISAGILADLGYDVAGGKQAKITTGSGTAYVREVMIDGFKLGSHVVENIRVYAHNFPDESFTTGVVGLNIISQFDIHLLFSKQLIEITKICKTG